MADLPASFESLATPNCGEVAIHAARAMGNIILARDGTIVNVKHDVKGDPKFLLVVRGSIKCQVDVAWSLSESQNPSSRGDVVTTYSPPKPWLISLLLPSISVIMSE